MFHLCIVLLLKKIPKSHHFLCEICASWFYNKCNLASCQREIQLKKENGQNL